MSSRIDDLVGGSAVRHHRGVAQVSIESTQNTAKTQNNQKVRRNSAEIESNYTKISISLDEHTP